jgi:hypothetical protein
MTQPMIQPAHDAVAHAHLGFCAEDDGYSLMAEVIGWRTYAKQGSLGRWLYRLQQIKNRHPN